MFIAEKKKRKRRRPNKTGFPRDVPKKKPTKKISTKTDPSRIKIVKSNKGRGNTGLQGDYWKPPLAKKREGAQKMDEKTKKKYEKPAFLPVGTKVSARLKGAFCAARVISLNKHLKITVSFRHICGVPLKMKTVVFNKFKRKVETEFLNISESDIISFKENGSMAENVIIDFKHPVSGKICEAIIRHINDLSNYHCEFDDGDIAILKRSSLVPQMETINTTPSTKVVIDENKIPYSIPPRCLPPLPSSTLVPPQKVFSISKITPEAIHITPEAIHIDDALRASSSSPTTSQITNKAEQNSEKATTTVIIHNDLEEEIDSKPPKLIPQAIPSWEHDDDIVLLGGNEVTSTSQKESLAVLPKPPPSVMPSTSTNRKMNETEQSIVKVKITFADNPTKKYLIKVQKKPSEITLSDLKINMPVSGNFRFFIKHIDEEDGECLFEEFLNESDILPLYDRQIVVECKSILN